MKVLSFTTYLRESIAAIGDYLAEALHLTHPEEFAFKTDHVEDMFSIMRSTANDMRNGKKSVGVGAKFDGAPAVVFGVHPIKKKFFVSTKGFFAKASKAAFTDAEVDTLFESEGLREKLKTALRYLPELKPKGIYQGDMMYTKSDLKKKNIDGIPSFVFRPNTITYAVGLNTEHGQKIASSQLGIVIHTKYTYKGDIPGMLGNQSFDVNVERDFGKSNNVWAIDTMVNHESVKLTDDQFNMVTDKLSYAEKAIAQNKGTLTKFPSDMVMRLETYINSLVRGGKLDINPTQFDRNFGKYYVDVLTKEMNAFKTNKKKAEVKAKIQSIGKLLSTSKAGINALAAAYKSIYDAKMIMVSALANIQSDIKTFKDVEGGLKPTAPEGFVASSPKGVIKLVDREEFSKLNFTIQKDWTK